MIRPFRPEDAAAVARVAIALNPHRVETPESVRYTTLSSPAAARRRDWVAEEDGVVIAHAHAGLMSGKARFWIGVHPDHRGHGLGGELYRRVEEHVAEEARPLRTWVDGDPAGERFVRRRGFELQSTDRVAEIDPREVDISRLPELEDAGIRLASLAETLDRVEALFETYRAEGAPDFDGWQWDELEHPNLSHEGSFVALASDQPVSLGFLTVDPERRVAYNQLTATLPAFRRRGLALLVKLANIRWAAGNGIERLLTENDSENVAMLSLNDSLGYRPLYDQGTWTLER